MVKAKELEFDKDLMMQAKGARKLGPGGGRRDNGIAVAYVASLACCALLVLTYERENWWAVLLMGVLFLISEFFALPMKSGGRISLAVIPVVVAMMVSGPLGAAIVALFGLPVFWMERGEDGIRRVAFNACEYFLAAGIAGWVFKYTGGGVLKQSLSGAGHLVFPWILATIVFYILNTIVVTPVLAPSEVSIFSFWQKRMLPKFPSFLLYSGIGFLSAICYVKLEFPALVLLFVPLVGMRVVYTRYEAMRKVCDDTTLAVIDAVEGRSGFREGHSVAVAEIACEIAEEMEFEEEEIHLLRQAALLHDIGKLSVDPAFMNKPGRLEPEEYDEIKKHPLTAAEITSKAPSISLIAPIILHHHEIVDGSGYVDGLAGDAIPLGARILAVADAYDAMQRPTPYKDPLTPYRAASEIIKSKGIQFDPDVVDAFVRVVTRKGIWTGALSDQVEMAERLESEAEKEPSRVEQPTLEEVMAAPEEEEEEVPSYEKVKDEIEEDIRKWEESEIERGKRKIRKKRTNRSRREKGV